MAIQDPFRNVDYQRRTAVDWNALTDKLGATVAQIGTDREKAREELEQVYTDTVTKLQKPLNLEKQSLESLVIAGSNEVKNKLLDLKKRMYNKEISPADYKRAASGYQEHWANLAEQVKTADDRFKLYQDRSTMNADGIIEGSDAESHLMNEYLKMADLNNKKVVVGNDGSMYLQQVGEDGQPVGELIDYRDFARPENMTINRVNLGDTVDGVIGNWKEVDKYRMLGRGGEETITSIKNQPDYKLMKINAAEAITSNPRMAVSVLVDNGVINAPTYYSSESEKDAMLSQALGTAKAQFAAAGKQFTDADKKAIELSFVKFEKTPAGILEPILTKEQMVAAKERVEQEIDMQIETKIQANPPQQWSSGGGGNSGGAGSGMENDYSRYNEIREAWNTGNMDILNNMNPKYRFKWDSKSKRVNVYSINEVPGKEKDDPSTYQEVPIGSASEAKNLAPYLYKSTSKLTPEELFEIERQQYNKKNKSTDNSDKPKKGDVVSGYVFLGGDPSNQNNWKKK
jgi:hypothetical protein